MYYSVMRETLMARETITFRTDPERRAALDRLAGLMERDRTYVLNAAIDAYLDLFDWQKRRIAAGLEAAERGDFAGEAEVAGVFHRARARAAKGKAG
ncbi:MAG: ribbon-helix-helix protein, CopG family [Amphiplicatus sp.]